MHTTMCVMSLPYDTQKWGDALHYRMVYQQQRRGHLEPSAVCFHSANPQPPTPQTPRTAHTHMYPHGYMLTYVFNCKHIFTYHLLTELDALHRVEGRNWASVNLHFPLFLGFECLPQFSWFECVSIWILCGGIWLFDYASMFIVWSGPRPVVSQ